MFPRFLFLLAALVAAARAEPLFVEVAIPPEIAVSTTANRNYRLLKPPGDLAPDSRHPLVVYLHSAGAKGVDGAKPQKEPLPRMLATPEVREAFPCFVLLPQCREGDDAGGRPNNWVKWEGQGTNPPAQWEKADAEPGDQLRAAMAALDHVLATQPIDPQRIYLAGLSMGGSGAWYWAAYEPRRFAAVLTACGLCEPVKAPALSKVPLWAFHGSEDPVAPAARIREMIAALHAAGSVAKYTEYAGVGHSIGNRAFIEEDHAVLRWLFAQRRTDPH